MRCSDPKAVRVPLAELRGPVIAPGGRGLVPDRFTVDTGSGGRREVGPGPTGVSGAWRRADCHPGRRSPLRRSLWALGLSDLPCRLRPGFRYRPLRLGCRRMWR